MKTWEILKKLQEGEELTLAPDSGGIGRKIRLYDNRNIEMIEDGKTEWSTMWTFSVRTLLQLQLVDEEKQWYDFL